MIKQIFIIALVINLLGCSSETHDLSDVTYFSDMIEIDQIESVKITNNYGEVVLNKEQLKKFQAELKKLVFKGNVSLKPGGINIELISKGRVFYGNCSTHGELLSFEGDIPFKKDFKIPEVNELYFEIPKGMNLDNYQ